MPSISAEVAGRKMVFMIVSSFADIDDFFGGNDDVFRGLFTCFCGADVDIAATATTPAADIHNRLLMLGILDRPVGPCLCLGVVDLGLGGGTDTLLRPDC